jgi:protein-disulfide isomerase
VGTKNERREAAREKARLLREERRKKDRRSRVLLQGGLIVGVLAIAAVIAIVVANSVRPVGVGPLNMASDGIQLGQGAIAAQTGSVSTDGVTTPNVPGTLDIQLYVDYFCPVCHDFDATNGDYITSLMDNGDTTVEIHPIAILDRFSQGTKYSTRVTGAAACVANFAPNSYYDFHNLLFANQPAENTPGLTDEQLIDLARQAGADVADCIGDQDFVGWAGSATDRAGAGPIPNSNVANVRSTPTVIVNGLKYEGPVNDLASFQAFVVQASAQ